MKKSDRILVTGAAGMVGQALIKYLHENGFEDVIASDRSTCDLEDAVAVHNFVEMTVPKYVFHIAAKVGGIGANRSRPVDFLVQNLRMQLNIFDSCHRLGIGKLLFLGSSCIYPRECHQPMSEDYLLSGPLEPTNEAYALAKIVGLKMGEYYHRQHKMQTVCPMPCNIYGDGDSFDLEESHVLSALVRRFCDAKAEGSESVTLWGTGVARREFIHVRDAVRAIVLLMNEHNTPEIVNVGVGTDISIRELAEMIASEVGYTGSIEWDKSRPDGMPRKCLDIRRLKKMGFLPEVGFRDGVRGVIAEYLSFSNADNQRS